MKVEVIALCDAASDSHGKLNLMGIFDTINITSTPSIHPSCAFVLRLRLDRSEIDSKHVLKLNILDTSSNNIVTQEFKFNANMSKNEPDYVKTGCVNIIYNLQGLPIYSIGTYKVKLKINNNIEEEYPFYVKKIGLGVRDGN